MRMPTNEILVLVQDSGGRNALAECIRNDSAEIVLMMVTSFPVSVTLEDLEMCFPRSGRVGRAMLDGLFRPGMLRKIGAVVAVVTQADIGLVPITLYQKPEEHNEGRLVFEGGSKSAVVQAKYCPLSFLLSRTVKGASCG